MVETESRECDRKRPHEENETIETDTSLLCQEENVPHGSEDSPSDPSPADDKETAPPLKKVKLEGPKESQQKPTRNLSLRVLIATNYSGSIIGRSGSVIASIEERSDAKVSVSEMIGGAPDRILTAIGMPEEVSQAIYEVANILVRAENAQYKTDERAFRKITLRFLIPNEIMGAIIGKGAVKVKEIQKLSGCRISAEQGLLLNSTERKMNVIGDPDAIRVAVVMVYVIVILQKDWTNHY